MKRFSIALVLFGCGSGFSSAPHSEGVSDGGVAVESGASVSASVEGGSGGARALLHGTGGARATGGRVGMLDADAGAGGAAPATGGVTGTGGAVATGGVTGTGGTLATGGAIGAGAGGVTSAGGGDGGVPVKCLTDLSGVGTGDFLISFILTTTESGLTIGLLNQRTGCDQSSTFWDVRLSPTAGIVAVTGDGIAAHYTFIQAGTPLNDGKPHKVDVIRRGGKLWYAHDGVIDSVQTSDPYSFGTFPPLVLGSSACTGTTSAAGHAAISEVCITES